MLPLTAFLIASVHQVITRHMRRPQHIQRVAQPLCMALKLVLTPIVSVNAAIPFVRALRLQSSEAAAALLSAQRSHMAFLDTPSVLAAYCGFWSCDSVQPEARC